MPTYDYRCASCGPFVARQPLARFDQPVACPTCATPAPRAISVPASMGVRRRSGGGTAEAAEADAGGYRRLRHGGGCGCCP